MDEKAVAEARKAVQSLKLTENMAIVEVGWSCNLVMPHKDAMTLLQSLAHAEQLIDHRCSTAAIKPLESDRINVKLLSPEDYRLYKMAQLMKVPYAQLQEYVNNAT